MSSLKQLVQDGEYHIALIGNPNNPQPKWPSDPPQEMDVIKLVGNGDSVLGEYCITSTRITLIGREVPGGPLGEKYGIVCAENTKGNSCYTLAGGRLEPSVNENRLEETTPAEETVLDCLVREVEEELKLSIKTEEVALIGLRTITEDDGSFRKIRGRICADACFLGVVDERLTASSGYRGETGERMVLPPKTLLARVARGEKPILPQPQALALAMAIIAAKDLFGNAMPEPLREIVSENYDYAFRASRRSRWFNNFISAFQG